MYDTYKPTGRTDDRPIVEFYADAKEDRHASLKAGYPQFRDVEMVKIRFPADRNRTLVRPALSEWKKVQGKVVTYADRFPEQYQAFKAGQAPVVHGMPLKELPFLTEANRRMLRALEVYTVEQLASLEGQPLKNLGMNGREMKEAAAAFLAKAKGSAVDVQMAAEIAALKRQIETMQAQPAQPAPTDAYAGLSDDDLKAKIKEKTGEAPRGNPRRETLVRMLEETHEAA